MRRKGKCVCCGKNKPIRARHLCDACYEAERRAVNAGKATWPALEKRGLAGKPSDSRSVFRKRFEATTRKGGDR